MPIDKKMFEADMHMHTVASDHGYSTVLELAEYAAEVGLKAIAVTDHGPAMEDGAHIWHFGNMRTLPPYIKGVRVLHGAEANITDFSGSLDLNDNIQRELDWVIASFHQPVCAPGTVSDHTEAYLKLAENPYVDVIGHSGSEDYKYDYERLIPVFKAKRKLIEINSHSFGNREGASENCVKIALLCKKFGAPIVVDSDAHSCFSVGDLGRAAEMLDSIDFPEELIVNLKFSRVAEWIRKSRGRDILTAG